ncbi:pickpocket protein 19-like [Eupeodes corollae]|uniref:pickpocket protein 19-like n=1 Tax=Eupeodes corollae TaxID=290404 RepID=UPI00248FBBB6|nr:pickpocket protein 19-like [Eupeodes corollae]
MAVSSSLKAASATAAYSKDEPLELKTLLVKYLKIYCQRSTVHGVKYIFDKDLNKLERLFWILIVMAAIVFSVATFFVLLFNYNEQIVLTVIDDSHYPVFNIHFPAVAVCTHERINWNKFDEARDLFLPPDSPNETKVIFREFVQRMAMLRFGGFSQFNNTDDIPLEKIDFVNVTELALFLSFECEELFDGDCLWQQGNKFNCCEIFVMEKSEVGFCWVFNSLVSAESKQKVKNDKSYPWRGFKSGENSGLNFRLKLNATSSFGQPIHRDGIDLMIKKSTQWTDVVYSIKGNTDSLVVIRPELKTTDPATREIPPEVRGCMFDSETDHYLYKNIKGLRYSQWNCFNVCHEEHLLSICNCTISIFFPQNDSYRECSPSDFSCLYNFREVFSYDKRLDEEKYINNIKSGMLCPCLIRCDSAVQYFVTISSLPTMETVPNDTRIMSIDVHYQTDSLIKYRAIREFTFMEMVASLGGIVGLLLGASILSGIEIIYHLTLGLVIFLKDNYFFSRMWIRFKNNLKMNTQQNQISPKNNHNYPKQVWHDYPNRRRRKNHHHQQQQQHQRY